MDLFEVHKEFLAYVAYGAGHLGCFFIWWSIELDHCWDGEWRWFWEPLGTVGDVLRMAPTLVGLPLPDIQDFFE